MTRSPAFEDWVDEARRADVWAVLNHIAIGHTVKASRRECVGPCPVCGGDDRFSVNRQKNVWFCRVAGKGGDAIALAEYVLGVDFLGAVEAVTGRPAPEGERGKQPDPEMLAARAREAEAARAAAERETNDFRQKEIARARRIWDDAGRLGGSIAESYLRYRGLSAAPDARLRSASALPYWHQIDGAWTEIHKGPAMVAAILGPDGRFIGCHCTWIDAGFTSRSGKAEIVHPQTGELLDAKKVRGSQKGGHIDLGGRPDAPSLVIGEGIETVYSVREALRARGRASDAATCWWAGINLGNIGGRAAGQVMHPTLTRTDKAGRTRRVKVPSADPDPQDAAALTLPGWVDHVLLLGDGDSDRFTTEQTLRRAGRRWQWPRARNVRIAWAAEGQDFNDMLRRADDRAS